MMERLEREAEALGFKTLTLGVESHNPRALQLYEASGYREFKREKGRTPKEYLLLMRKAIGEIVEQGVRRDRHLPPLQAGDSPEAIAVPPTPMTTPRPRAS